MAGARYERQLFETDSRLYCEFNHNIRVKEMRLAQVPVGWVVNGELGDSFWNKVNTEVIPIKPGGKCNKPGRIKEAQRLLAEIRGKYGRGIEFMAVYDEETPSWWSAGPVLLSDLEADPEVLIGQCMDEMNHDQTMSSMKRRAYMIVTGFADTQ
jgi:hypothetical protein